MFILAIFPAQIAPYSSSAQDIPSRLEGPSWAHLMGTDHLGRDLLSRLIYGTRIALEVAIPAVTIALLIGLLLGLLSGYLGGWSDRVLVVLMDALQAFPAVILALALLALLGASLRNVAIAISVAFIPNYARVSRAMVISTKEEPFIEAERAIGAGTIRIITVHLIPNILAPLIILLAMDIPSAVVAEAGLSFLGLGVQPPTPSWGLILSDGFSYIRDSAWAIIGASLVIMVVTLAFTVMGEALREIADPRSVLPREKV